MIVLDTNSLIRFFTNDEPKKALKVKKLLEKERKIVIPEVVFPELEYVLRGSYRVSRKKIIEVFQFLLAQTNIKLSGKTKKAMEFFEKTRLDMADCLILAEALKGKLASFDKKFLAIKGIKRYW